MPLGFPEDGLESGMRFRPAAGDVFVVSYPKCGTTWLQYIVYLLIRQKDLVAGDDLTAVFPHLEEVGADTAAAQPSPRLLKTHLPFEMTPFCDAARYLVIARNPFDCVVSFYHHTRGFPRHYDFAAGSFADFLACFLSGEVDFGSYFGHLLSWYRQRDCENVMFLTYEDLHGQTAATVGAIAGFLGEPANRVLSDSAALQHVLDESGIASMRRNQQRWSSQRPDWATDFVRKGDVGGWRELVTPVMAGEILATLDEDLAGAVAASLWPGIIGDARDYALGKRDYIESEERTDG